MDKIYNLSIAIELINEQLRNELFVKNDKFKNSMLWENTFIKKQFDKRNQALPFSINDHIRAMVYSMLSSGSAWSKMLENIDVNTGKITCVDNVFCNYDTEYLIKCSPNELTNKLLEIRCGTQYINKQMPALIENIKKLIKYEKSYGNVDNYYQTLVNENDSYKALITALSNSKSNDKMLQMDIALTCEYLRNVGYNLPKPDRHLCRILGSEYLGLSKNGEAKPFEVIDIINEVSSKINKPATEIDYIIWSYCANGYGEICTKKHKHCDICKLNNICNKGGETK